MQAFEENEISKNSFGGTELSKRSIAANIPEELSKEFQIIASRVREINPEKIRIYWQHDLAEDPEVNHLKDINSRNRFHKLVFVSNWQMNDFVTKLGLPMNDKLTVIENPVVPIDLIEKQKDKINLIYFSTPHRGLNILVPVFEELAKKYNNIHLNVFSSFQIYGWPDADKPWEPLYDKIRNHPQMTYHGFAPNEEVRKYLQQSHILAYPCTWKETSCRVLIESMSAGLLCVHPNLAALPDTSGNLTSMYQYEEDLGAHAKIFYNMLEHSIKLIQTEDVTQYLKFVKAYADTRFHLDKISKQWEFLMESLLKEYPDVSSRSVQTETFSYKVG